MTLLIALILLANTDAGFWSYIAVFAVWVLHLNYHGIIR